MEEYRDIKGYEGVYQVSNLGNVRRLYKKKKGFGMMKPINHSGGYSRLKLRNKGNDKDVYIHRLVADAFLIGENEVVNHKDGNKKNNTLDNLELCTQRENVTHAKNRSSKSSIFSGVRKVAPGKWEARLFVNGVRESFGFKNCETAAYIQYLKGLKDKGIKNIYA